MSESKDIGNRGFGYSFDGPNLRSFGEGFNIEELRSSGDLGVFGRALPAQTHPTSHQLRKS